MNYYGKYLPDLATVLNPLHRLLHKCQQWKWDQSCEDAFRKVKELFFFFNNVIYFIQMLATINTPKVQAPFGVSLLHLVLIIQGYNQNYMKYIYNLNTISI